MPSGHFKLVEEISEFNEDFIKTNDENDEGYFLEVDVQYPENLHNLQDDLPFLSEKTKIEIVQKLVANSQNKKMIFYTHKKFKTKIKPWISIEKSAQNHQI